MTNKGDVSSSKKRIRRKSKIEQASEIGDLLKSSRQKLGLEVIDVANQLKVPANQIAALEIGQLDIFPSQLVAVKILRQYATALKLDGDYLALILMDSWNENGSSNDALEPENQIYDSNASGVVSGVKSGGKVSSTVLSNFAGANRSTSEIPIVGGGSAIRGGKKSSRERNYNPRKPRTPASLKVTLWILVFLVIVGLIGLYSEHTHPSWFLSLHAPTTIPTTVPVTAPATTAPSIALRTLTSTASNATYSVASSQFSITVAASGQGWVEVSDVNSGSVLFEGTLNSGDSQHFANLKNATIQAGSASLTVSVETGSTVVGNLKPPNAPYVFTIQGS